MEISFANNLVNGHTRNENINSGKGNAAPVQTREQTIDTVSSNIRSGMNSQEIDADQLLEQTVEASAQTGDINEAHDFDMARVMRLLSDPLLQEDTP
ncbi:hypothetical protein [Maridesulfovibrio frigidus]|uniref:hypothetical protein n=1 Tax=Maridesulfovibrio frigidus TaxID=340956 RepID=UPI0004E0B9A2|nr:hypothetical protein [Maridesulfovibrio frigidus]